VALVFGSGEGIWLARSLDNGRNFGAPSKVAELPKMLLGRHRGPRVVISGNAIVVSAIASEPGDLMVWRSTDGGRTWSAPHGWTTAAARASVCTERSLVMRGAPGRATSFYTNRPREPSASAAIRRWRPWGTASSP
jgi:hypothetical protein